MDTMELHGASVAVLKESKTLHTSFVIIHRPCRKCKFYFLLNWIFSSARGLEVCACDRMPHPILVS